MTSTPRRHHFLPCWYLSGFTRSMEGDDDLCVTEVATGRQFHAAVARVAVETDLYKMDFSADPGALERSTALIDDRAAAVVRSLHSTLSVPTGKDLDALLAFVALMFLRTPAVRDRLWGGPRTAELVKAIRDGLSEGADIPHEARSLLQEIKDAGRFDEYQQVFENDRLAAQIVPRANHVVTMVKETNALTSALRHHKWTLWVGDERIDFVCSDFPAWVLPLDVTEPGAGPRKSGFSNAVVGIPLSRKMALLGSPDEPISVAKVGIMETARFNLMTCMLADRYIYSATKEVCWLKGDHPSSVNELVGFLADRDRAIGGRFGWQALRQYLARQP